MGRLDALDKSIARTEPGPGGPDDGSSEPPSYRSIPNVSTGRLIRAVTIVHGTFHTVDGLRACEMSRGNMLDQTLRLKAMVHELHLRGEHLDLQCRFCG